MLAILQQYDISQYEFEEFCDKWTFTLFEKAKLKKFNGDYDQFWGDFLEIKPDISIRKYKYITKLGTQVIFKPSSKDYDEEFWTFELYQTK